MLNAVKHLGSQDPAVHSAEILRLRAQNDTLDHGAQPLASRIWAVNAGTTSNTSPTIP